MADDVEYIPRRLLASVCSFKCNVTMDSDCPIVAAVSFISDVFPEFGKPMSKIGSGESKALAILRRFPTAVGVLTIDDSETGNSFNFGIKTPQTSAVRAVKNSRSISVCDIQFESYRVDLAC